MTHIRSATILVIIPFSICCDFNLVTPYIMHCYLWSWCCSKLWFFIFLCSDRSDCLFKFYDIYTWFWLNLHLYCNVSCLLSHHFITVLFQTHDALPVSVFFVMCEFVYWCFWLQQGMEHYQSLFSLLCVNFSTDAFGCSRHGMIFRPFFFLLMVSWYCMLLCHRIFWLCLFPENNFSFVITGPKTVKLFSNKEHMGFRYIPSWVTSLNFSKYIIFSI